MAIIIANPERIGTIRTWGQLMHIIPSDTASLGNYFLLKIKNTLIFSHLIQKRGQQSTLSVSRGFTLIELLVVIAIIGILSSVVLASLSTARNKAKITAVKAGLNSLRTQVEVVANGGGYGAPTGGTGAGAASACTGTVLGDTTVGSIITNVNGNALATVPVQCSADSATAATKWSAAVEFVDSSGTWCVDSSGAAKGTAFTTITTSVQNNGVCI